MAPRMRRGSGVRAILAAGLVAVMAAAFVPASAAVISPVIVSINEGWNSATLQGTPESIAAQYSADPAVAQALTDRLGHDVLSAQYTRTLDPASSTAEVRDDTNTVVPGFTLIREKGIAWVADATLPQDGRVYTVTFAVNSVGPSVDTGNDTLSFKVDREHPSVPALLGFSGDISMPSGMRDFIDEGPLEGFDVNVSVTGPGASIVGSAFDATGVDEDTAGTSGIRSIQLRFFDPLGSLGHTITIHNAACGAQCTQSWEEWEASLDDLPAGLWTVKVVARDLAGLESGPTRPITFLNT